MPKIIDDTLLLEMLRAGKSQKECAAAFGVSPAAVCKRIKRLVPVPQSFEALTEKEKTFVLKRVNGKSQTSAAAESFDCSSRDSAKALGHTLGKALTVQQAISDMMEYYGLTRAYRAQKVKQHVDHPDPNVSLKALDMSWKLDGSYAPTKSVNLNMDMEVSPVDLAPYLRNRDEDEDGQE